MAGKSIMLVGRMLQFFAVSAALLAMQTASYAQPAMPEMSDSSSIAVGNEFSTADAANEHYYPFCGEKPGRIPLMEEKLVI